MEKKRMDETTLQEKSEKCVKIVPGTLAKVGHNFRSVYNSLLLGGPRDRIIFGNILSCFL
jgi:hypothetical protein